MLGLPFLVGTLSSAPCTNAKITVQNLLIWEVDLQAILIFKMQEALRCTGSLGLKWGLIYQITKNLLQIN